MSLRRINPQQKANPYPRQSSDIAESDQITHFTSENAHHWALVQAFRGIFSPLTTLRLQASQSDVMASLNKFKFNQTRHSAFQLLNIQGGV